MKPLRTRLQEARKHLGVPWETIERDYLLSWVLAAISRTEDLEDMLIFKGGTALKKCYFGDYRFSEDLDFTGLGGVPVGGSMERHMQDVCRTAMLLLDEYTPVDIECERYTEKEPHPTGQEAFTIRARLPWQRRPQTRVMVEVTTDEDVLVPPVERSVLHEYGEPLDASVRVYTMEEIVAEKLRAILQHVQQLETRGWGRSRARDYYDLWRVLHAFGGKMDLSLFPELLRNKCVLRDVSFKAAEDFFPPTMTAEVERTWKQWLGPLVPELPSFRLVIGELRPRIKKLVSGCER